MVPFPEGDDKAQYPGVVIDNVSFGVVTSWKGDYVSVGVQPPLKVGYFIGEAESGQCVLLFSFTDGGGEALGNVKDSGQVVLVELHHMLGRGGGDGVCRSHGGLYGGQRANGCFDQSVDGNVGHPLGSVGVMIRAGVVFAEPGMGEGVVGGLVVDPEEEELSWLKVGLELKGDDLEGESASKEGLRFGCDHSGERAHLALIIVCRVFIESRCWCWYCAIKSGAWI
jgi:hypothetical protein